MKSLKDVRAEQDRKIYDAVMELGDVPKARACVAKRFKIGRYRVTRAMQRVQAAVVQ